MLHLDDPDHKRLRNLVAKAFNVQAIEAMRGRINEIANRLLDAVAGQPSFDVVDAYAKPLPTIVIATMLGVNESDQENFKRWSDDRAHIFNPTRTPELQAAVERSQEEFTNYLLKVIEERRRNRGSDLISSLINVEEGGEQLTVPEIVSTGGWQSFENPRPNPPHGCMGKDPNPEPDDPTSKWSQFYDCVAQLLPPLTFAKMATIATADSLLKNVPATVARLTGGEYFKLGSERNLERDLTAIGNHLPNRYILSFHPHAPLPDYEGLKAKSRTSY